MHLNRGKQYFINNDSFSKFWFCNLKLFLLSSKILYLQFLFPNNFFLNLFCSFNFFQILIMSILQLQPSQITLCFIILYVLCNDLLRLIIFFWLIYLLIELFFFYFIYFLSYLLIHNSIRPRSVEFDLAIPFNLIKRKISWWNFMSW